VADVLICATESSVKSHPNYAAAKLGSTGDAWALAVSVLSKADRVAMQALIDGGQTLVSVQAFEGPSVNRIPVAMAQWLHGELGGAVDRDADQPSPTTRRRIGHFVDPGSLGHGAARLLAQDLSEAG